MKYLILFSLFIIFSTNAELFSAVSKLEVLLETQKDFIDYLEDYFDMNWSISNRLIKSNLKLFKSEHELAMKDKNKYLGNPVNSFRLIKRLTVDVKYLTKFLNQISDVSDLELDESAVYPTKHDLLGAAEGLLRLQTTYNLDKNLLAEGIWNTSYGKSGRPYVEKFPTMTVSDCYELGKAAYKIKLHGAGIDWLKIAARKFRNDYRMWIREDMRFTEDHFYVEINKGYSGIDREMKKVKRWFLELSRLKLFMDENIRNLALSYYSRNMTPKEAYEYLTAQERRLATLYGPKDQHLSSAELNSSYVALCKGERTRLSIKSNRVSCFYAHGPHKFLKLAPLKVERLHIKPNVMLYHEIIHDAEIQTIINITKPKLVRANVFAGVANVTITSNVSRERVCQVGYLMDNESAVVARVRRRISQFSGMNLAESKQLQVANYGIGGYHALHYDYSTFEPYIKYEGNRIATAILYLSDVDQGGATIFPALGLSVFPVKGSVLYWLNLRPSGVGDPSTFHAACPVLWGSKWGCIHSTNIGAVDNDPKSYKPKFENENALAAQWIKERGQELRRPCPIGSQPRLIQKS